MNGLVFDDRKLKCVRKFIFIFVLPYEGVGSISVAILPSCQCNLQHYSCLNMNIV